MGCLKCGDTGIMVNGEKCDCGAGQVMIMPAFLKVPPQYQGVKFSGQLLPKNIHSSYAAFMTSLLDDCTVNVHRFNRNVIVCSPPNTGKTVFAYTVNALQYAKGQAVLDVMDIMEVRELIMGFYGNNKDSNRSYDAFNNAKVAFIKIPQDLPYKLAETMSTVIERRVRAGNSTVFLFSGSKEDLVAQDKFGKLQALFGDGSYNSLDVKSWTAIVEEKKQ